MTATALFSVGRGHLLDGALGTRSYGESVEFLVPLTLLYQQMRQVTKIMHIITGLKFQTHTPILIDPLTGNAKVVWTAARLLMQIEAALTVTFLSETKDVVGPVFGLDRVVFVGGADTVFGHEAVLEGVEWLL